VAAFAAERPVTSSNDLGSGVPPPPEPQHPAGQGRFSLISTPEGARRDFAPDLPTAQTNVMAATQGSNLGKAFDEKCDERRLERSALVFIRAEKWIE